MNLSTTLDLLSQDQERQRLEQDVSFYQRTCKLARQSMNTAKAALAQLPELEPEDLEMARTQKDLMFHQLLSDLNQTIFEHLKVGDAIWVWQHKSTFVRATLTALEYKSMAFGGGHVTWKCHASDIEHRSTFVPYPGLNFLVALFLPTRLKDLTVEQTQQVFRNVCTISGQPMLLFHD